MTRALRGLRMDLASKGIELTQEALNEVLQAGAHIASLIGGICVIDTTQDWALWVEISKEDPEQFWADLIDLDDADDSEEEMFH